MEYKSYRIQDLVDIRRGASPRPIKDFISTDPDFGFSWVKIADATKDHSRFLSHTKEYVSPEGAAKSVAVYKGDLILSNSATPGLPKIMNKKAYIHDGWLLIRNFQGVNRDYLYYLFLFKRQELLQLSNGSVFNNLKTDIVKNFTVDIPSLNYQNRVEHVLTSIDAKIEVNNKLIANLEELSQTLFKRWFVDFEFPNKEGNSYKTYRGKMIQSELGEIPERWQVLRLEDIAHNYNTVRKPLSKLEREKQENNYPYYGATKIIDYVGNYLFDGKYILVGEDGTVKTDEGTPFTQYIWGQFWVSNHAHVLKGKTISDELLLLNLKNVYIEPFITGAVQPKLNKKNLNSIKFLQADESTLSKFERIIQPIYGKVRELTDESNYLRELRDTLLPKLMSGEIELPDELEVDEHAELLQ